MWWLVVFVVGMVMLDQWRVRMARKLLIGWAAREGYEIVSEWRTLIGGPFWWRMDPSFVVFEVVVRDARGQTRSGFVSCCPECVFGVKVRVIWRD